MRRFTAIAATLFAAACAAEPPTAPATLTAPLKHAGDQQSGTPGYVLAESLAVRVTDGNGEPVAGVGVTWETQPTHGSLTPGSPVTNADGIARAAWRLPNGEGTHWASARVGTLPAANFSSSSSSAVLTAVGGNADGLCGLLSDGTIRCWLPPAREAFARSEAVPTNDRFVTLGHAGNTWCAVGSTGRIACFTRDDLYRTGTFAPTLAVPTLLTSFGPRLVSLAGASAGSGAPVFCGLTSDYEAWCWGSNEFGQLGNGTRGTDAELPERVGDHHFIDIDLSATSACAITMAGVPYCWGSNGSSLIGSSNAPGEALTPTQVVTPYRFFTLALSSQGTACGIRSSGQVVCWGHAARDALGRPGVVADDPRPTPVLSDNVFVSIARNGVGFSTVSYDRELVVWGALPNASSADGPGFGIPTRVFFDERFTAMLQGGTEGYACMKSLFGGARCVDLYVLGPAALREANTPARPAQFGVPTR